MLKIKLLLCPILLFLSLGLACVAQTSAQSSISGEIKSLPKRVLKLILEEDINRKKNRSLKINPF
jgi:hypothetical protein